MDYRHPFLIRPHGGDAPRYLPTASFADDPLESVRIVNFEDGLYEAKQEAQYGNLAIFRGSKGFFQICQWIKTYKHWSIMRQTRGVPPQSGDVFGRDAAIWRRFGGDKGS
jgi:hypothetical protein